MKCTPGSHFEGNLHSRNDECRQMKMKELQKVFVKETGVASWDEVEIEFTTAEALDELFIQKRATV